MVRELYVEPTKIHKEAMADLVVNRMMDGINFEILNGSLGSLLNEKDVAEVFSLALLKGGLKSSVMAWVISGALTGNKEHRMKMFSEEEETREQK